MTGFLKALRGSVSVKIVFIGLLVLLLLMPMSMIESLIHERRSHAEMARSDIAQAFGRAQTIAGPLLLLPYRYSRQNDEGETIWYRGRLFVSPSRLDIRGELTPQIRYRGLHQLPVYGAALTLSGAFPAIDVEEHLPAGAQPLWGTARLALAVSDPRPIKSGVVVRGTLPDAVMQPGGPLIEGFPGFLVAALDGVGSGLGEVEFSLDLQLDGSERIAFAPIGDTTRVQLRSSWASPSFDGAYLPDTRRIDDDGFSAQWTVLNLGRGFPSLWRDSAVSAQQLYASTFGVRLYEPASAYQQGIRAAKYAVLFLLFTFGAYFLMEIFAARVLHPLQYLLVGFANCMFYLLLVSLSEHLVFPMAYLLAAAACTALIAGYSASVLGSRRRAGVVGLVVSLLYAFLYVVLRSEDHALLMGSLALFAALGAVMFLTRRVDWYALHLGQRGAPAVSPPA